MILRELFNKPSLITEGIEHFEDTIFTNGSAGAQRAAQSIAGLEKDPVSITIKWDGFPAVMFGRDADGNLVFVDKHQFDKIVKGKEEFSTIQSYDERRGANRTNLWEKEQTLRPTLEKVVPQVKDIYWGGDLMWTGTPPVKDGYFVFKPNTVEYKVKIDDTPGRGDTLSDKIARSIGGIAVHTFIPGLGSSDQPLTGLKGLDDDGGIVFLTGEMKTKPKVLVDPRIKLETDRIIKEQGPALDKFLSDIKTLKSSVILTSASPFITSMLEDNDIVTDIVPRFLEFLKGRLSQSSQLKLLGSNQDGWLYQEDGGGPGLLAMWSIWASLVDLKLHVKQQVDSQQDGSDVIAITAGESAHEGYVFGGGKEKIKLIDRLGFSRANFARHKPDPTDVEEKKKMPKAIFCFGRMNPPTLGHAKVMETTVSLGGDNGFIFLSNSHKAPDDPLDPATKAAFIRSIYPQYANNIVDEPVLNALFAANWLYDKGFRNMTFVGGSDRLGNRQGSIEKLLNNWNSGPIRSADNVRGPEGREYVFLEFVSSGNRDADSPGVEGFSGTKARKAAEEGNEQKFQEYTGVGPNIKVGGSTLFQVVRKGLGLEAQPAQPVAQQPATQQPAPQKPVKQPQRQPVAPAPTQQSVAEDYERIMSQLIENIIKNEFRRA
jgi:hypothetical protein